MTNEEIKQELTQSALYYKQPLNEMSIHAFYLACNYQIVWEESMYSLKDQDLRMFLLFIAEDINNG